MYTISEPLKNIFQSYLHLTLIETFLVLIDLILMGHNSGVLKESK